MRKITIKRSWIVQRLNRPRGYVNPYTDTIRDMENKSAAKIVSQVFSPDYMGAAEYEMGRLPESMHRMFENRAHLSLNLFEMECFQTEIEKLDPKSSVQDALNLTEPKREIYIVCDPDYLDEIKQIILKHYHQGYINWQWMNYSGTQDKAKKDGIEYEELSKRDYGSFYLRLHTIWRTEELLGWYDLENDFAWFINQEMAHLFYNLFNGERFKGWD